MKKYIRNLLKGLSLTTAMFVFQACYGTPSGFDEKFISYTNLSFKIVDNSTNSPIQGVVIKSKKSKSESSYVQSGATNNEGVATVEIPYYRGESPLFMFEAPDYQTIKDTTFLIANGTEMNIRLKREP